MAYSFDDPDVSDRHETQYFEMFVNRGIYHKGWTAVTRHSTPWITSVELPPINEDVWELYGPGDWTQAHDLAEEMPETLHELQRLWLIEAARYNVLPLDDRGTEKMDPDQAGRPVLIRGNSQILFDGMSRLSENAVVNIKNKSHSVTANVEIQESGAEGVIIAQGANFGGWAIYAKGGKLKYAYNFLGLDTYYAEASSSLPAGDHQVRMEFAYDGGGAGKGGNVSLYVDGQKVGEGRVEHTHATIFSCDSTLQVGDKHGAPICADLQVRGNRFNGKVNWVEIQLDVDDHDHFVSNEELLAIAMARQ